MPEDGYEIPPWFTNRIDLFLMWKSITYALISTRHVAKLYQELDHASRIGRDLSSDGQWVVPSYRDPTLLLNESLQIAANNTEYSRSVCGYDDEESSDKDTVILSLSESDIDEDYNLCEISSTLIAEAADLSHYRSPLPSFEDVLAQEELLLLDNKQDDVTRSVSKSSTTKTPCYRRQPSASTPPPSLPNSNQEQWLNKGPSLYIAAKQYNWANREGQDSLVKWREIAPPPSTTPQTTARSMEPETLQLSDKKDLMPFEIIVVAQRLIKNDSVNYFLNNCRLIYESLMPSIVQQPLVCNDNSIKESVIAAFDTIQFLVNGKHIHRLLLRFAYIHLVQFIHPKTTVT